MSSKKTQKERDFEQGIDGIEVIYEAPLPNYSPSHFAEKVITEELRQRFENNILDQTPSFVEGENCQRIILKCNDHDNNFQNSIFAIDSWKKSF